MPSNRQPGWAGLLANEILSVKTGTPWSYHNRVGLAWVFGSGEPSSSSASDVHLSLLGARGFFAWVYDAKWGFFFAAISTIAALPGDYIDTHTKAELLYAAFSTYTQLTGAVIGCVLAKMIRERSGRS
ncbi:hypothetical protein [Marinobacter shengliensis]|uniref:hypothetical protein n=1 Tax=Marinobacter shengliensis TaxID=1389223 RepID=UPI0011B26E94|nr:hypothetical protein [Marinobacter shengliensis]